MTKKIGNFTSYNMEANSVGNSHEKVMLRPLLKRKHFPLCLVGQATLIKLVPKEGLRDFSSAYFLRLLLMLYSQLCGGVLSERKIVSQYINYALSSRIYSCICIQVPTRRGDRKKENMVLALATTVGKSSNCMRWTAAILKDEK